MVSCEAPLELKPLAMSLRTKSPPEKASHDEKDQQILEGREGPFS